MSPTVEQQSAADGENGASLFPSVLRTLSESAGVKRLRVLAVAAVLGFWALFYFAYIQAVQPWGREWLFEWVSASFIVMAFVPIAPAVLIGYAALKQRFGEVLLGLALLGVYVLALWGFHRVNWFFRSRAVSRVVHDASRLTNAIRAYSKAQGTPPSSLDALVPSFLQAIPSTGMGAYPSFEYQVGPQAPAGEEWAISVSTSLGILNWDILLYLPSGQYPAYGYGGRVERFGDWAYVHE